MRASRFSEEQIIGILREHEGGAKTPEVCQRTIKRRRRIDVCNRFSSEQRPNLLDMGEPSIDVEGGVRDPVPPPNGKSAHTLLDKWSASRAIIKNRV
jgi:hypothetical protein